MVTIPFSYLPMVCFVVLSFSASSCCVMPLALRILRIFRPKSSLSPRAHSLAYSLQAYNIYSKNHLISNFPNIYIYRWCPLGLYKTTIESQKFHSTLPTRGSDNKLHIQYRDSRLFQSTLPARGATRQVDDAEAIEYISIHAPARGSDCQTSPLTWQAAIFQSTLPTRGSDSGKVHLYAAFPRIC